MSGKEKETSVVKKINKFITEQKKLPGKVTITTCLFNEQMEYLHQHVPLDEVPVLKRKDYIPCGRAHLLDAVGGTLSQLFKQHLGLPEAERPQKTLVVIMTDGEEIFSSRIFVKPEVKVMIELLQRKCGWEFLYFGANVDHFEKDPETEYIIDHL